MVCYLKSTDFKVDTILLVKKCRISFCKTIQKTEFKILFILTPFDSSK